MTADPIVTLWIGSRLGPVERACLRSWLRHGHEVALYCYGPVEGIPAGIDIRDAASILDESKILRHRGGSVALFANWFRYELQRRGLGIWLDMDQYLLSPISAPRPYLYGWQEEGVIATAVLRIPTDSPLLAELIAIFEESAVPFWLPLRHRLAARLRRLKTGRTGLPQMPWGSAGPNALTALAIRHGLATEAISSKVFYPVHYANAGWLRDPSLAIEQMIAPETIGIHFWNEVIKDWKNEPAPPGTFLARLHQEGA